MRTLSHTLSGQAFIRTEETCFVNICMHVVLHACNHAYAWLHWDGVGGVQGFRLKSRDFGQPVQGSALSRLASM